VATGHVKALLAGGRIMADRIEFDPTSRQLLASGSVRFQRGQQCLY
jgi:lipopolysaccharide assembly outer membrane protein LptD (OstA)